MLLGGKPAGMCHQGNAATHITSTAGGVCAPLERVPFRQSSLIRMAKQQSPRGGGKGGAHTVATVGSGGPHRVEGGWQGRLLSPWLGQSGF